MQAEISHVYNSSEAGTNLGQGYGWRLSCVQRLDTTGIKEYPYVYTDEDGTKHYFYKDTIEDIIYQRLSDPGYNLAVQYCPENYCRSPLLNQRFFHQGHVLLHL